jgi:uncharacterized protein
LKVTCLSVNRRTAIGCVMPTRAPAIDPATRRSIDMFLARIADRYPVREAWLYGSRARGDARADSDADLAVVLDEPTRRTSPVALEWGGEEFDIMMETGVMVSAMPVWIEQWEDPSTHSNPYLIANIKREGLAI